MYLEYSNAKFQGKLSLTRRLAQHKHLLLNIRKVYAYMYICVYLTLCAYVFLCAYVCVQNPFWDPYINRFTSGTKCPCYNFIYFLSVQSMSLYPTLLCHALSTNPSISFFWVLFFPNRPVGSNKPTLCSICYPLFLLGF